MKEGETYSNIPCHHCRLLNIHITPFVAGGPIGPSAVFTVVVTDDVVLLLLLLVADAVSVGLLLVVVVEVAAAEETAFAAEAAAWAIAACA